jgi:predicted hydrocarbon binding protein
MTERKIDNFTMRIWLETIENILGSNGLKSVLNYSRLGKYIDNFPPYNDVLHIPADDMRSLFNTIREMFGKKGAHALQIRVGREAVRIGQGKYNPAFTRALQLSARILSEHKRMRLILEKYAEDLEKRVHSNGEGTYVEVQETDNYFLLIDRDWVESEGVTSDEPVCGICVGMLQYLMEWITGHIHHVEEIECRAMGDEADVFKVVKAKKE